MGSGGRAQFEIDDDARMKLPESVTPTGLRTRAGMVRDKLDDGGSCARHLELAADEIEKLRAVLERCRQYVREVHHAGSWWNDSRAYELIRENIDPALGTHTR